MEPPSLNSLKNVFFQTMKGEFANHFHSQSRILDAPAFPAWKKQTKPKSQTQICNNLSSALFPYFPSWSVGQQLMPLKHGNMVFSWMWRCYKLLILDYFYICVCMFIWKSYTSSCLHFRSSFAVTLKSHNVIFSTFFFSVLFIQKALRRYKKTCVEIGGRDRKTGFLPSLNISR